MANTIDARAVRSPDGGWFGQFRKITDGEWRTVCHDGTPATYDTADQAELAAWRIIRKVAVPQITDTGYKADAIRAANAIFRKGRMIPVVER